MIKNYSLPYGWKVKKISELVNEGVLYPPNDGNHGGLHPKSNEYTDRGIPFLMASDVQNDRIDIINCKFISKEKSYKLQKGFAKNGDILFTHKGSVGNVALLNHIRTDYVVLSPQVTYYRIKNHTILHPLYVKNFLQSDIIQKTLKIKSKGTTKDYISIVEQQKLKLIIPPLHEQIRIAEILTACDNVIILKEKLIAEKNRQKKWLTQNLITGKKRLNGFNKEWRAEKLGNYIKEVSQRTKNHNQYPVMTSSRKGLFLQNEYFSKSTVNEDNTGYKIIKRGEFTYRPMSDDGIFVFNRLEKYDIGIVSSAYYVFSCIENNGEFLYYFLNDYSFNRYLRILMQGGTRLSLRFNELANLQVIMPELPEQRAIADILSSADYEIDLMQGDLNEWRRKKKALMQALLSG